MLRSIIVYLLRGLNYNIKYNNPRLPLISPPLPPPDYYHHHHYYIITITTNIKQVPPPHHHRGTRCHLIPSTWKHPRGPCSSAVPRLPAYPDTVAPPRPLHPLHPILPYAARKRRELVPYLPRQPCIISTSSRPGLLVLPFQRLCS